jgi:hypothetical protein
VGLKKIFQTMKSESSILKPLDQYLLSLNSNEESDRATHVNSPSQISTCLRARYYARMGVQADYNAIDPRTRRIFDNGNFVHIRLQEYLTKQGILLMDEVPLRNDDYNIQGHTDGYLRLSKEEVGILEIKSIKQENFAKLKDAEYKHKEQALIYMYCAEMRRKHLRSKYKTEKEFLASVHLRAKYHESLYWFLESGNKHTKEEKIKFQVDLCMRSDEILFNTPQKITKVFVLYENKNSQEIKEFCVEWDMEIVKPLLEDCDYLEECIKTKTIPERAGKNKSDSVCRYCNFRSHCFVV